jgi:hypothetical protein
MTIVTSLLWPFARRFGSYAALVIVSLLAWHLDSRAVANADALRAQATRFRLAQAAAAASAQQALDHQNAAFAAKAKDADNAYQSQLAAARSAADRYIAAYGMQSAAAAGGAVTTPATSAGGNTRFSARMPTDAVMVSANDVQSCTDATTYALKAHDWAIGLQQ